MATKKPKSGKSNKDKTTTKPKTAAKTVEKPVSEAPIVKTEEKKPANTEIVSSNKSCFSGFFAKKYTEKESILTVFKSHKFYGALLGEVIGTAFLTILLFSVSLMGLVSMSTYVLALVAILIAVYAFSGACLNPLVTVGMMASRRMSAIRGVMYIIAEIVGAWLGWLIFNSFHLAAGEAAYDVPMMAEIAEGGFWPVAFIELLGAVIIAFFFARALKYKRSIFTFAATISGGIIFAIVAGYVISAAFFGLSSNFIFNPAAALMFQIFPTAGESFLEILGGIAQALAAYALLPMIGGVVGFYLADFTSCLSAEE